MREEKRLNDDLRERPYTFPLHDELSDWTEICHFQYRPAFGILNPIKSLHKEIKIHRLNPIYERS